MCNLSQSKGQSEDAGGPDGWLSWLPGKAGSIHACTAEDIDELLSTNARYRCPPDLDTHFSPAVPIDFSSLAVGSGQKISGKTV